MLPIGIATRLWHCLTSLFAILPENDDNRTGRQSEDFFAPAVQSPAWPVAGAKRGAKENGPEDVRAVLVIAQRLGQT